jgi:hypothetical protein
MRRWLMIFAVIVACHHDPDPALPVGTAPLPPASGTPIGFLIDDADLHLSTDQLGKLRDIDTALAAQIDTIDKATRSANKPASPDPSQQQQQSMGRHGRRGGMGGGGGGGQRHSGSGGGSAAAAATTSKLADERTEDVKAALARAFALLDPKQQARAKQVLADHDVDLDLDAQASPSPGSAASEEPAPVPPPTLPPPPPTLPPPSQSQQP